MVGGREDLFEHEHEFFGVGDFVVVDGYRDFADGVGRFCRGDGARRPIRVRSLL